MEFSYYNLEKRTVSRDIGSLFPGWGAEREVVVVLSPHDDDAILGAGYLIQAVQDNGGEVYVCIYYIGDAGYSSIDGRDRIVEVRMDESKAAYKALGLDEDHVIRFNYPDFSVEPWMGRFLPGGGEGTFAKSIKVLRRIGATRLVVPNPYREHADHEAVGRIGMLDGPQVGDEILVDWGKPCKVRTFLQYTVWADFGPEDALVSRRSPSIRANRALKAPARAEEVVSNSLAQFKSQERIIQDLLRARKERRHGDGFVELYLAFDPRPCLDFRPYKTVLSRIDSLARSVKHG